MHRTSTRLAPLALATLLSACGGGGGSSVNVAPSSNSPTTSIVTNTVASSYTGEELAAFNAFNNARISCGFGSLVQNAQIDTAALNHVNWMVLNNTFSHSETSSTPGYTGANAGSRLTAAGYTWQSWGEVMTAMSGSSNKSGFGLLGARNLLAAPYHLMGLMQGNREIGLSLKSSGPSGADLTASSPGVWLVGDMASRTAMPWQSQAATEVLTYPCQGITGTAYQLTNESPDPFSGTSHPLISTSNPIGQPIFVQVLASRTLTISSASMVRTSDSSAVVLVTPYLTGTTDTVNRELGTNQAILIPNTPLLPNTQYTVTVSGSNNGTLFSKTFSFTTGS